jgi:hypothetical protein
MGREEGWHGGGLEKEGLRECKELGAIVWGEQ